METNDTQKNPLDEMDDGAQSNGAAAPSSDAQGGDAGNSPVAPENGAAPTAAPTEPAAPTTPQAPQAPAPETPAAPAPSAAPETSDEAPQAPQNVMPRMAAVRGNEDHGIIYGKRKAEIAEVLKKQPKVAFMIPRQENELNGLSYETVQINGHRMEIRKGVMVQIPQQVAEILAEKYRIQTEAGADKLIGRSEETMDRLT